MKLPQIAVDETDTALLSAILVGSEDRICGTKSKYPGPGLRNILNTIPGYILALDNKYTILDLSQSLVDLYKLESRDWAIGKKCYEAFQCKKVPCEKCPAAETAATGKTVVKTGTARKGILKGRSFKTFSSPFKDEDAKISGVVISVTEVSDLRDSEKELREERMQQLQKLQALETFAGGIAHDFNNILMTIMINAELAANNPGQPEIVNRCLERIINSSQRAGNLVDQIMVFSRRGISERTPLAVTSMAKEAVKKIQTSIPPGVSLKTNIAENCGMVKAAPLEIHTLIISLCDNAVKAVEGKKGRVSVKLQNCAITKNKSSAYGDVKPGKYLKLTVKDNGKGMNEQTRKRIFTPFFTTRKTGKGSGMGLSMVHGIVKSLGGGIKVESVPGKGSLFEVLLPEFIKEKPERKSRKKSSGKKMKQHIMFVDDEPACTEIMRQLIVSLGYQATSVVGGDEALELFRKSPGKYDLVISDLKMPIMKGDELAREIMQIRPGIPVVLCTGCNEVIEQKEIIGELGIREILVKPFLKMDLAVILDRIFNV